MSNPLEPTGWIAKLVFGVASATVIGGGTMVLNLHRNDAVQDEKILHVQSAVEKIDDLDTKLDATLRSVDVLNARLEAEEKRHEPRND